VAEKSWLREMQIYMLWVSGKLLINRWY